MYKLKSVLRRSPIAISVAYIVLGSIWILYSDRLVITWVQNPELLTQVQSYKGWFFVSVTGIILYSLIRKQNNMLGRAVDRLRETSEEFRITFESAPLGIAHHRKDESWIQVNQTLCNMLGYSKEELMKMSFDEFIHPDDLVQGKRWDQELSDGQRLSYKMEKQYKTKNGDYFYGLVHKSVIKDEDEDPRIVVMLEDISEQKKIREKLSESVREKEVLLAEVHHRVRNNLALISALFQLQSMKTEDEKIKSILKDSLMRIKCLSLVHETYAGNDKIADIKFSNYVDELSSFVDKTLSTDGTIILEKEISDVELNINQAIPAGLLCNELLIQSYLKSFEHQQQATIKVILRSEQEKLILQICDNGIAQDEDTEIESLRKLLIETLVSQLGGTSEERQESNSYVFETVFRKKDIKGPGNSIS